MNPKFRVQDEPGARPLSSGPSDHYSQFNRPQPLTFRWHDLG